MEPASSRAGRSSATVDVIVSAEFKRRVEALGGYGTQHTGQTVDIGAAG